MDKREFKPLLKQKTSLQDNSRTVAEYLETFKSLYSKYREYDSKRYQELRPLHIKALDEVKADYKLRVDGLTEAVLLVYLNCCTFDQIKEEFMRFIKEFDDNFDGKLQLKEMENCFEMLAEDTYIGKSKIRIALIEMGVQVDVGVSFLKEGSDKKKLIDKQISGQLKEIFSAKDASGTKRFDYIQISVLIPYLFAFWLEYEVKGVLRRQLTSRELSGVPFKPSSDGLMENDPTGRPTGLCLALMMQFGTKVELSTPCLSYRHVVKALESFRQLGFSVASR